jgi:hypothetical protein
MNTWLVVVIALATWAVLRGVEVLIRHLVHRRRDKKSYRAWKAQRGETLTALQREAHARAQAEEAARKA